MTRSKREARMSRHRRVRKKVHGTAERPRLAVSRSNCHIYAQIINDDEGVTLASASSLKLEIPKADVGGLDEGAKPEGGKGKEDKGKGGKGRPLSVKMLRSRAVGEAIAGKAAEKGIEKVTLDRGGNLYHGRVMALAEAARKAGLKF